MRVATVPDARLWGCRDRINIRPTLHHLRQLTGVQLRWSRRIGIPVRRAHRTKGTLSASLVSDSCGGRLIDQATGSKSL